jgi:hypothetical protein
MISTWLLAFTATEACEVPVYVAALSRDRSRPGVFSARVAIAFAASLITHPLVWFVFPRAKLDYLAMVALAESFAVLVEAAWLRAFGLRRALAWSIVGNGTSVALGLVSRSVLGYP